MKIKKKKKKFGDTIPLRIAILVLLISDCILARDKYIEKINTNSFGSLNNIKYDGPQIHAGFLVALVGVDNSLLWLLRCFLETLQKII